MEGGLGGDIGVDHQVDRLRVEAWQEGHLSNGVEGREVMEVVE